MRRNSLLIMALLFVSVLLWLTPFSVMAQTPDLSFDDIIETLKPRSGRGLIYDLLLYAIFIIAFINQFLIPDKQLPMTILNFTILGLAIAIKLLVVIPVTPCSYVYNATLQPNDYPIFFMNIWLVIAPLLIAGGLRKVKGKSSSAVAPAILTFILAAIYFFFFWVSEQGPCSDPPSPNNASLPVNYIVSAVTVGVLAVQNRLM
jgi:hypothetical protein